MVCDPAPANAANASSAPKTAASASVPWSQTYRIRPVKPEMTSRRPSRPSRRVRICVSLCPSTSLTHTGPAPGRGRDGAVVGRSRCHRSARPRATDSGAGHGEVRFPRRRHTGVTKRTCQARSPGQSRSPAQVTSLTRRARRATWYRCAPRRTERPGCTASRRRSARESSSSRTCMTVTPSAGPAPPGVKVPNGPHAHARFGPV